MSPCICLLILGVGACLGWSVVGALEQLSVDSKKDEIVLLGDTASAFFGKVIE